MTDALRVGLVGVGWGALVHAPAFRAVDGYELVALCSRRPDSVARAGEKLRHHGHLDRLGDRSWPGTTST